MPKQKLFVDDSESEKEVALKTENVYAKKYDAWREKEERHKLEQKYGDKDLNSDASSSSDSEDDSDEPPEVTEEMETQFLKTLSLLKTKDPRIYDPQFKFFENDEKKEIEKKPKTKSLTFADSDEDDDDDGNIFKVEKKAEVSVQEEKEPEPSTSKKTSKEGKVKAYLVGKAQHIDDPVEQDLAPLKALWSDPKLSEGEAFLRDYILNKKYLEDGDIGDAEDKVRDDEDLEADEKLVEEQGKFERAYNFRFEEPDDEYLKRFPRTMNFIRPKDDRRSRKRAEVRERKEEEKKKKMEEIARLKALKLKEIQEKIAKIKEVTGNEELAFKDGDIEGDFDPDEHDRRMKAIFDEQYYGEADEEKPVFPDLDEELEIENWEKYEEEPQLNDSQEGASELHCEDEDFNMDADYDPKQARANLLEQMKRNLTGKKPRHRKKKSKLQQILATEKPKFVPTVADKTYAEYMEEYYKMDCEDVIGGDLPTRFKYREVVPNSYGLTIEEILLADDKELTQWVPLKRIIRHRPENVEKGEVKTYAQRAKDEALKKKMLPSLFKELPEEPEIVVPVETKKKKKKQKNKKNNNNDGVLNNVVLNNVRNDGEHDGSLEGGTNANKQVTDESIDSTCKEVNKTNEEKSTSKKMKNKRKPQPETIVNESATENGDIKKKNEPREESSIKSNTEIIQKDLNSNRDMVSSNKNKKKKHNPNASVAKSIQNSESSQGNTGSNQKENDSDKLKTDNKQKMLKIENKHNNLKRKLNSDSNAPSKKRKTKNKNKLNNDKNAPQHINKNDKNKSKGNKKEDLTTVNPLSKLSDERLKAYGLNPKKYRSFLKYKKF